MKKFIKENWFKILLIIAVFLYLVILGFREWRIYQKDKPEETEIVLPLPNCEFVIENNKRIGNSFSGLIRNTSEEKQYLKAVIAKFYDGDNVLISDDYFSVNEWLSPNKAVQFDLYASNLPNPYKVPLVPDIYPYFSTCK